MLALRLILALVCVCVRPSVQEYRGSAEEVTGPYERQIRERRSRLRSTSAHARARAAEALGFLRAYAAEAELVRGLTDPSPLVRRQVALALAWCGGRDSVRPLIDALDDVDPTTRQAAHTALTNLTGMEFPFDAAASEETRTSQCNAWREWWKTAADGEPPAEVLQLLASRDDRLRGRSVTTSSTYKGGSDVLVDGHIGPEFWQTKNVPFPQSCTVDLGRLETISRVIVHQYGVAFVMTAYELATSVDGLTFEVVAKQEGPTPVRLSVTFRTRPCRFIRVTSLDSANRTYPTTFFEVEVDDGSGAGLSAPRTDAWKRERGLRALGALGGPGASEAILASLAPRPSTARDSRLVAQAGIRALGRLRDEDALPFLLALLDDTFWARHAAEALGDFGDRRAISPLVAAYGRYAKRLDGANPSDVPADDRMGFPSEDRMLETPYRIAFALCRLLSGSGEDRAAAREIAPRLMANLPGDHDTFLLYEPEVGHLLTRHLLELGGLRQDACEHAFAMLGQPRRVPELPAGAPEWPRFGAGRMATWLPALCTEEEDLPRLVALLEHEDGWVRLNAAKTLAWIGDPRAAAPIAALLASAPAEAAYGYSGTFKDEEYADPAPRWREGLVRALGLLGAREHAPLIVRVLEDERSVLEVRHAAARALADLGGAAAHSALRRAAVEHPFHTVRLLARDALRASGVPLDETPRADGAPRPLDRERRDPPPAAPLDAIVFVRGDNSIPNTIGTVEQADRWRQTYVVTDSGPAYRPGRNLYTLRPVRPDGTLTALTRFAEGYVAEPEVAWDGGDIVFTHRGQDDPWWHVWRIQADGSGLEQLTHGPYHDVGPAYLPDGRIVFASTRAGIRDEYHGYPCTSLHVMHADGSGIHPITTNIGRDNEPAILPDGRIVFSRLEVFYSRNKTELTLHAMGPDGVRDTVLYGPERRTFWRTLDHGAPTPADGQEAPLTHRVLRMTQPQPMPDGRRIVVVTQGGLTLVGPLRDYEQIITPDNETRSYTTPWPLPDGRILCASTLKTPDRAQVDLGIYSFDPGSGALTLVFNDPGTADFEPRPLRPRPPPRQLPCERRDAGYDARFLCASVFTSQEQGVAERGRLVRLIEGTPVVARHSTQTNEHEVWKNHGGTLARVLGTAPLAADGSFYVEVPADRLLHFQVLDSDRRVIGNQKTWITARAGETRSCIGCHETPDSAPPPARPIASRYPPLEFLPEGDEFHYRAKAWFKGSLPDEIEERTRTVRAVGLLAR
ncbi:MAG: hypothetical protein GY711_10390 [bacterium]|nr:hypothetical protein [bacterium]